MSPVTLMCEWMSSKFRCSDFVVSRITWVYVLDVYTINKYLILCLLLRWPPSCITLLRRNIVVEQQQPFDRHILAIYLRDDSRINLTVILLDVHTVTNWPRCTVIVCSIGKWTYHYTYHHRVHRHHLHLHLHLHQAISCAAWLVWVHPCHEPVYVSSLLLVHTLAAYRLTVVLPSELMLVLGELVVLAIEIGVLASEVVRVASHVVRVLASHVVRVLASEVVGGIFSIFLRSNNNI